MTTQQVILFSCFYLAVFVIAVRLTHATARRVIAALAAGAVVGVMVLGVIAVCETLGWWRVPIASAPYFLPLLYCGLAVSCAPIYIVTWRVDRRFGWRGVVLFIGAAAIIGPPRDYMIVARFPNWMVFAPGVAPILADAATYAGIVAVGHYVTRFIADELKRFSRS